MTRQTFGGSMQTPKNCTRFSCFISFIYQKPKSKTMTTFNLKDTSKRQDLKRIKHFTAVNSPIIEGFWKLLVPGFLMYLMATWFPFTEEEICEGSAYVLYNNSTFIYASAAKCLPFLFVLKLLPGTGQWLCRCFPSLSYPSNHNCCWRNWTESCRFHYDWLC